MLRIGVAAFVALCGLMAPAAGWSQARLTGADIDGTVRDESGAVIPGASITVTNAATNLQRTTVTDAQGRFNVPALSPGRYRVAAEVQGFTAAAREDLELQLGQSITVDFSLRVAAAREVVTVQAPAPLVDVHNASVSQVLGGVQIENLPIDGRNFISFAVITAGVTQDRTPQQGASATSGLSFGGQRARSNNIMVDGLDNNDASLGAVRAVFSQEAIREFQVLTSSYSAEFGKASGGVVNIVTKSGTNDLHGNVFGYLRHRNLNAKDYFEKFDPFGDPVQRDKSPFRQFQYGTTAGGPIVKNRAFYFLAVERLDQAASNLVTIDETAAALLSDAGFPVTTGANPFDLRQLQLLAKVDHQWKPTSNIVVRGIFSDITNENIEPFGGLVARSRGAVRQATDSGVSASQSNVFSGRWVNEARVQYARQDQEINSLDPRCGGPCDGPGDGGPTIEVTGVASVGRQRFTPQPRLSNRIQAMNTVSLFAGAHQIKTGVEFNHIRSRDALPLHFGGRYIFGSLQAFAAGTPAAYVQGYGEDRTSYRYGDLSLFVQDEWRVSPAITVKPGLRYQKQFFPDQQYDVSDLNGSRFTYGFASDNNNVAPRLSISVDPGGSGRTAIHGSYGLFFDNHLTGIAFITDVIDGLSTGVRTLVGSGALATAAWQAPGHRLTEAQALGLLGGTFPSLVISIDPDLRTPYAHQASVGFERALGEDVSVRADVLYTRGFNQLGTIDYNPRVPALGHPARRPNDIGGVPGTSASVLQYTSFGETWYRGFTVTGQKRYRAGSQLLVSYTLSKAEDNSTDFQSAFVPQSFGLGRNPADPRGLPLGFDPDLERGPAAWDERHRLVISGLYQLPGAVQVSAIVTAASGRPFTALAGADLNGDGNGGAAPPDRARRDPSDISTSVGRYSEDLPAQFTVDMRVARRFRAGRHLAVEPMLEVFNLLNRTNYADVNNVFGIGAFPDQPARDAQGRVTYGRFTQAYPPRQVQLAAKLIF
jgi:hypothetical protein